MPDQSSTGHSAPRHASTWRAVLATASFRRLLAVRLVGQTADGLLQVGVAGFIFFSPERAADPASIAAGLAVLLLPYSLLGPFAGVLLDRWSRRQVLVTADATRAVGLLALAGLVVNGGEGPAFYLVALAVLGLNRFVLASLGAALPHVVAPDLLVTANAVAPSAGTVATAVGAGLGVLVRTGYGGGDTGSAAAVVTAAVACLAAGLLALRLGRHQLGPAHPVQLSVRHAAGDVVRGVVAGVSHLAGRPPAARALLVLTGDRLCYGIATVWVILLFRNSFHAGDADGALEALGLVVVATGLGVLLGAATTPVGTRLLGTPRWSAAVLLVASATQLAVGIGPRQWSVVLGTVLLAAAAQAVKIGVDTVLQSTVADEFRGRVFTVYDLLFNASFVAAAAVAALFVPPDGESVLTVTVVAAGYLALAVWYGRTRVVG